MRLDHSSWYEVDGYLSRSRGIIIPAGSTEQHGPIGLIGTDAICAGMIAERAAMLAGAMVAPTLAYAPARFNLDFPGTVSVSPRLFQSIAESICRSLGRQGFEQFYFLNGHGANLVPLRRLSAVFPRLRIRIVSWWDFPQVEELRQRHFGEMEGMHATPSEISMTRMAGRILDHPDADRPPASLSPEYIRKASGDRHGPPRRHRAGFPDGRVGSHSALATPELGRLLLEAAARAVAEDYRQFLAA